jgi:hypothetical protein
VVVAPVPDSVLVPDHVRLPLIVRSLGPLIVPLPKVNWLTTIGTSSEIVPLPEAVTLYIDPAGLPLFGKNGFVDQIAAFDQLPETPVQADVIWAGAGDTTMMTDRSAAPARTATARRTADPVAMANSVDVTDFHRGPLPRRPRMADR